MNTTFLKKALAAATVAATVSPWALPSWGSDILFTRMESATYDCLDYASKVNCDKAEQAAKSYQAQAETKGLKKCAAYVMGLSVLSSTVPLVGSDLSRPQVMGQLEHVKNNCPGSK